MSEHDCLGDHFKEQIKALESERDRLKSELQFLSDKIDQHVKDRDALKAELALAMENIKDAKFHESSLFDEISKLKAELLLKLSDDENIKQAVFLEADRWRAKENKCIDRLRASVKTLEGIADKYQSRAAKYKEALEKIGKNVTHVYWESRGMENMEHADTCPCKVVQSALEE